MPQAQQLDPRDGSQLQNRELLTPERMKGMGDLGQAQRRFGLLCSLPGPCQPCVTALYKAR